MLIGELINNLAQKAGIVSDNPELKALLSSPELATIQVPEILVSTIDKGLLSIEAAKNNHPDIKKKYFADAYDGMDKQLLALVANDTFDQADLDEITAEKSTSKKAEMIVSKLKAAKKADKGSNAEEWNKKIADANEAARLAKAEVDTVKNEYESKIKDIHLDAALTAKFGSYKTIYDDLPAGVKPASLKALIQQALQDKKAKFTVDENGTLQVVGIDGSNVFGSNHVQLTADNLIDQSFAPILKVSGPPKPAAPAAKPPVIPTGGEVNVSQISNHNAQVIADMAGARPSMM
jgi:hypothetical protein